MDFYHPTAPTIDHWSNTPPTDDPNTRSRMSFGLAPLSGQFAPLPPALCPSPAESPNEQWSYHPSSAHSDEGQGWQFEQEGEEAQWRQDQEEGPAQYAYNPTYDPPPPGSFFALDPSLPLPSPAELDQYAYPLQSLFPSRSTTTIYSWESSSAHPSTYDEPTGSDFSSFAELLPLAGNSDVTGLVSREEWLRLGGFEEGGSAVQAGEEQLARGEPFAATSRRSRGDFDHRSHFGELPSPHYSFPSPNPPSNLSSFALEQPPTSSTTSLPPLPGSPFPVSRPPNSPLGRLRPCLLSAPSPQPRPLPSSIPSFPLTPLPTLPPALNPSRKSHSRRHSASHIPRPRNAFILFRQHAVSINLIPKDLDLTSHSNISQVVGAIWRGLSAEEKRHWELLAEEEKRLHKEKCPEYAFRPKAKGVRRPVGTGKKALASKARREAEEAALGGDEEAEEMGSKKRVRRSRTVSTSTMAADATSATRDSRRMELVAQLEGEEQGSIGERVEAELALEEGQLLSVEELAAPPLLLPPNKIPRPSLNRPRPATYSHPPVASRRSHDPPLDEFGARSTTYTLPASASPSIPAFPSLSPSSSTFPRSAFRPSRLAKRGSLLSSTPTALASFTPKHPPQQQQALPFHLGGVDLFSAEGTQQAGDLERLFGGRGLRR